MPPGSHTADGMAAQGMRSANVRQRTLLGDATVPGAVCTLIYCRLTREGLSPHNSELIHGAAMQDLTHQAHLHSLISTFTHLRVPGQEDVRN